MITLYWKYFVTPKLELILVEAQFQNTTYYCSKFQFNSSIKNEEPDGIKHQLGTFFYVYLF